jgi:phosphate uptake regulator
MNSMTQLVAQNQVYDAEGFALAYEQVADIAAMLDAIQHKQERTIEYVAKVYNVPESVFKELTRLFQITESMIQDSMTFSKEQEDSYKSLDEGKAS